MGSFFAGIKAGTLAGLVYIAGLAAFNLVALSVYKEGVLAAITRSYSQTCVAGAGANATSLEDCYASVLSLYIPLIAFLGFFVVLFFAGALGALFDSIPGRRAIFKGEAAALLVGLFLVFPLNLALVYQGYPVDVEFALFYPAWTLVFGALISRFYLRYTRKLEFVSAHPEGLRLLVDGRDVTGRTRTLAQNSIHKVRAEASDEGEFREWAASGGIRLEDARSFETVMDVEGDGRLVLKGGRKQ
ncbi:MAG: hypothetical protein HY297_04525 [Thaumarchaeota archaeon]|nr:hypothetical protein [Nitrososphaerota archaeon]